MLAEELVRACLGELGASDEFGIAGKVAEANRVALLGTKGVAAALVGYAVGEQDADREPARLSSIRQLIIHRHTGSSTSNSRPRQAS